MKRVLRRKPTRSAPAQENDGSRAIHEASSAPTDIFEDRRKQQIPFPASRCRRVEDRFGDAYDDRPWYLRVNYVTHHASAGGNRRAQAKGG